MLHLGTPSNIVLPKSLISFPEMACVVHNYLADQNLAGKDAFYSTYAEGNPCSSNALGAARESLRSTPRRTFVLMLELGRRRRREVVLMGKIFQESQTMRLPSQRLLRNLGGARHICGYKITHEIQCGHSIWQSERHGGQSKAFTYGLRNGLRVTRS
jgi:hypothetical protein